MNEKTAGIVVLYVFVVIVGVVIYLGFERNTVKVTNTATITCAIINPNGPIPTIKVEATDVEITDFGIIRTKEGLYVPTTNEICIVEKGE